MKRIAIVDDKVVCRKIVHNNLDYIQDFKVVFDASNGEDFLERMETLSEEDRPEVVLMDIDMPRMNGIEAIAIGSIKYPNVKYLVLTVFDDDVKIFEAIQAGASGYLLKDDTAIQLAEAISSTIEFNATPMSPIIARKTLEWVKQIPKPTEEGKETKKEILSAREIEILKLMVQGLDYKQIADRIILSPFTIRTHISKIYEKLHVNSKALAIQMAYKHKWI